MTQRWLKSSGRQKSQKQFGIIQRLRQSTIVEGLGLNRKVEAYTSGLLTCIFYVCTFTLLKKSMSDILFEWAASSAVHTHLFIK